MSRSKTFLPKLVIKPGNGRDYLIILLISGVTKAGVHRNRRKDANKKACRKPVKENE